MNNQENHPKLLIKYGQGEFNNGEFKFQSNFAITYHPSKTIIETSSSITGFALSFSENEKWRLKGTMESGERISADNILVIELNSTNNVILYEAFESVRFFYAKGSSFSEAHFPLINLYEGSFQFDYNNFKGCLVEPDEDMVQTKLQSRSWGLQLEGKTLQIKSDGQTAPDYVVIACHITSLLSLAFGKDISFDRQLYFQDGEKRVEIWRRRAHYYHGYHRCIPLRKLNKFLVNAVKKYSTWDKGRRKEFNSAVSLINSSGFGFLDHRLLKLCIGWEALANNWESERRSRPQSALTTLKNKLKQCVDDHHLPDDFDKSFIKTRISEALDFDKTIRLIEDFLRRHNLDQSKLNLELRKLFTIRNKVAHSGQIRIERDQEELVDLLFFNKLGLQVFLLKELGYENVVESKNNQWLKETPISYFQLTHG